MPTGAATNLFKNAQATALPVRVKDNILNANAAGKRLVRRKGCTNANNAKTL